MRLDWITEEAAEAMKLPVPAKDRNALRATGPRTPEGKAASSRNAIKHGLTARQVVIRGENQADFDALLEQMTADRGPEGEIEIQIVGEIAACTWRLARARAKESEILTVDVDLFTGGSAPGFDRLLRYMNSIERELNRAIVRLQQLQAERRKLAEHAPQAEEKPKAMAAGATNSTACSGPEFVSSNRKPPASETTISTAAPAVNPDRS